MIVLVGETTYQDRVKKQLKDAAYIEETVATHLLANAMGNSTRDLLHTWLTERQAVKVDVEALFDKSTTAYGEWVARMKTIDNNTAGNWFVHDLRPFFFWDDFVKVVGGSIRVIAIWEEGEDSYKTAIRNFIEPKLPKGAIILNRRPTYGEIKNLLASGKEKKK